MLRKTARAPVSWAANTSRGRPARQPRANGFGGAVVDVDEQIHLGHLSLQSRRWRARLEGLPSGSGRRAGPAGNKAGRLPPSSCAIGQPARAFGAVGRCCASDFDALRPGADRAFGAVQPVHPSRGGVAGACPAMAAPRRIWLRSATPVQVPIQSICGGFLGTGGGSDFGWPTMIGAMGTLDAGRRSAALPSGVPSHP